MKFHLQELERLRDKQFRQLQADFDDKTWLPALKVSMAEKKERKRREIDTIFDEYMQWIEDTMTTEDNPFIQVIAVLTGES